MAGIGFELQRVLKKGGVSNIFKAALAGIIIVAGPWLLSIIGLFFLYHTASSALQQGGDLFTAVIVYSYAFSLSLFGGIHYIFTRYISDLIYINRTDRAFGVLLLTICGLIVLSGSLGVLAMTNLDLANVTHPLLFKISSVILFIAINLIWLVMIYITLLKRYMIISLIYLGGMAVSILAAFYLGRLFFLSGAIAGYCIGQVFIFVSLLILISLHSKSAFIWKEAGPFLGYFGKYKFLLFTGILYSAGMWVDKILLWVIKGSPVYGTFFKLFASYDMPVYLANLTIIPGLVYFMIFSESNYFIALKRLLLHLNTSNLTRISSSSYKLSKTAWHSLRDEAFFQGIITMILVLLAPDIKHLFMQTVSTTLTLRVTFTALFFNLIFLTSMTFLFYLEKYKETFISAGIFFSVNFGVTLYAALYDYPFYGTGYLIACVTGSIVTFLFLFKGIHTFVQNIFSRF